MRHRRFAKLWVVWAMLTLAAVPLVHAQTTVETPRPASTPPVATAKAPEVSETSKLRLQTFAQQAENAQLRGQVAQLTAQVAQADYDKARAALEALVRSLQVDGYTLDLGTLRYAPRAKKDDAVK